MGLKPRLEDNMLDPEHTKSHEIGLNAGFLNDKNQFGVYNVQDIYFRFTVWRISFYSLRGYFYFMYNGYKVDNKGFELILSTNMNIGQVKVGWTFHLFYQ